MEEKEIETHVVTETRQSFSEKVEEMVYMKDIPYLEAVQELVTELNIEVENIKTLLNKKILAELEIEAEKLFLLKEKKNRLV